jgi:DNA-binding beta-propeller fold protein YncE
MSLRKGFKLGILLGFAAVLQVGCGGALGDEADLADAGAAEGDTVLQAWKVTRSGNTGTPADSVTDMVLDDQGLVVLPNPRPVMITDWQKLPAGRTWGAGPAGGFGPDGNYWQLDRCGSDSYAGCLDNPVDYIMKFDVNTGALLKSFGAGDVVLPHGIHIDSAGFVWVADMEASPDSTKGLQVLKYSPDGELLMRIGTAGKAGNDPTHFMNPEIVITAPDGSIFVTEGECGCPEFPGRIKKFTADGTFIKGIGDYGSAPGEFKNPHSLAFDSKGRLFVADRSNHRIQIFDQDLNYLDSYYSHGRTSALFIRNDSLYTTDSTSSWDSHPGWLPGVRIGPVDQDIVTGFIPPHGHPTRPLGVSGGGIAVAPNGTVYLQEGPGAREGLRGTGLGEGGTIIYHRSDISFPNLQGRVYRPRG